MTEDQWPAVSVIVPCLDAERDLAVCLASVHACRYPALELIVVDNGSRDRSVEIANQYATRVYEIPGVTISALRNRAAAEAQGRILAFLDADCVPHPNWLREGVSALRPEPCVAGHAYDVPEDASWIERDWSLQRDPGRHEAAGLPGGNLFVEKDAFHRIGGFDERLRTGEDAEFCKRASQRMRVISDDRIRVVHLGNPKTLAQFLRREIWYGLGAFGSLSIEKFDLPLIGTLAFLLSTLGQLAGLAAVAAGHSAGWLLASVAMLFALLGLTLTHRRRFLRGVGHTLRLACLYYLYYLGRTISLFYVATGRPYYHFIKS